MSKEDSYRVWNKSTNEMFYFDFNTICGYEGEFNAVLTNHSHEGKRGVILSSHKIGCSEAYPQEKAFDGVNPNLIFLQYTNIKDINRKKIFHHDVVKIYGHSKYNPDEIVHDLAYIFWDERELTWMCKIPVDGGADFERLSKFYILPDYIEVVGNLYENPELLGVEV